MKGGKQLTIKTLDKKEVVVENTYKYHCLFGDVFRLGQDDEKPLIMIGNSRQYLESFIKHNYSKPSIFFQEVSKHSELVRTDNLFEHLNISACDYVYRRKKDDYFGRLKDIWCLYSKWYSLNIIRGFKLLGLKNDEIEIIKRYPYPHRIYNKILKSPWEFIFLSAETQINLAKLLKNRPNDIDLAAYNLFTALYKSLNDKGRVRYNSFKTSQPDIEFMKSHFERFGVIYDGVYLSFDFIRDINYQIEQRLRKIAKTEHPPLAYSDLLQIELSDNQREAIQLVANNGISCILGPAGTGKTTIVKSILTMLRRFNYLPLLVSYTGRACRRLEEITQMPAKTLHQCVYGSINEYDTIIFDEIGMIPSALFLRLLYKLNDDCRLIMVGDFNQLPPIKDYSIAEILRPFPRVVLNQCLRASDKLFRNCQQLYTQTELNFEFNDEFQYHQISNIDQLMTLLKTNTEADFKIITPLAETTRELTLKLDNTMTGSYITDVWKQKWYLGEKVMFIFNNYKEGIMNSDEGQITNLTPFKVNFNGKEYNFQTSGYRYISPYDEADNFNFRPQLNTSMIIKASVITIHKAQGNEWNEVWFYLSKLSKFISRKLIYTALTRAKKKCLILTPFSIQEIYKFLNHS